MALLLASAPAEAQPPRWHVIPEKSALTFQGTQMGGAFSGAFRVFTPVIDFDPAHLDQSKVTVEIDITSLDSGERERDTAAKGAEWFDVKTYPRARFESHSFTKTGTDIYAVTGNLTIREVTLPVTMPFTLTIAPDESGKQHAVMSGHTVINRAEFKLGRGEWADFSSVGRDIGVDVRIEARQP